MTVAWKMISMLWPFLLEFVAGRRMGFMEAYKTKPRQLFIAMGLTVFLFVALLAIMRLYALSIEVVEKSKEIDRITLSYNAMAKKYGEPPLIAGVTGTKVKVANNASNASSVSAVTNVIPHDPVHDNVADIVDSSINKIRNEAEK
jgi:hypothetical protein